jgi:hypothetical protein
MLEVARLTGGYENTAAFQQEMKRTIRYVRQQVEEAKPFFNTLKQGAFYKSTLSLKLHTAAAIHWTEKIFFLS